MAYTKADLFNMALDRIGSSEPIKSTGDDTLEARVCLRNAGAAMVGLLSYYSWSFARRTVGLPRLAETPAVRRLYAYALPSDLVTLLEVCDGKGRKEGDFAVENNRLLCDLSFVYIQYVTSSVTEEEIPPHLVELYVIELARRIYPALRNTSSKGLEDLQLLWQHAYPVAMGVEMRTTYTRPRPNRIREWWKHEAF